ncbi:HEPN domain-containing protein [Ornithinibacillus halophilus]|uniref:HEPN domain-containing protein n=1 Tax=Ornithinibacillus halophilus TaxID=930117 RepID=A0A1M5GSG0_9BACI|nr:HEPN domain-containing protein [Ornithinibacillus halophilus]SHG06548.1 HEPN domain-containing protein [Ornithinibacillus halophilus]
MNRRDLQKLAEIRLKEATILFEAKCYAGAYYLAGYVIECALKAWIAKNTKKYDFPDKTIVNQIYTHNVEKLIGVIGARVPKEFEINWTVIRDWSEKDRYEEHTMEEAKDMLKAINDPNEGVLRWIKEHW